MHLLQRQGEDSFRLVSRLNRAIPPYAILSHTWGADKDEVTFQDFRNGTASTKAGYRKIKFCAEQAARDRLEYFWIDTVCIDKTNSTELQEAINSMFRWYENSVKCYVYLDDVSSDSLAEDGKSFQKSRWFTRGWTLQELIAPKCVEFFSKEGYVLGNKSSRVEELTEITGIPAKALEGKALSHFSVDERMTWTRGRETTREEDMAYSLLGIFDIQMPLIYGEGREKALRRLHKEIAGSQDSAQVEDVPLRSDYFELFMKTGTMLDETNDEFTILMGDSDKDGPPDMIVAKRTGVTAQSVEINVLHGDSNYQRFVDRIATPDFTPLRNKWTEQLDFTLADWNGDGTLDLIVIKKSFTDTHTTEVHIFSGASKFQQILMQTGTILPETDETWSFGMGRWSDGSRPDLFAIKRSDTGTKSTEVHVLHGDDNFQSFILQTGTGLHETDSKFDFLVTDWNGDGRPDLVAIQKSRTSGRCTEVHVLSGASMYRHFILRSETPMFRTYGMFEFAVAHWSGSEKPDLIGFRKRNTDTNTTEVHVMVQRG